jgi:hypothetical protein
MKMLRPAVVPAALALLLGTVVALGPATPPAAAEVISAYANSASLTGNAPQATIGRARESSELTTFGDRGFPVVVPLSVLAGIGFIIVALIKLRQWKQNPHQR